ncbi:MAG: hypothetical protein FWE09_06725 [Treponema sp.]|nr:hypothetical protein [Treponema sp.]
MPIAISVISLCVSVFSLLFFRWYLKRKTSAAQLLAGYEEEVGRLIAEIDRATDRDAELVEERIKILRKILEDTDKRIAVYVKEAQRSRDGEAMYSNLGRGIRAALDSRSLAQESAPQPFGEADIRPAQADSSGFESPDAPEKPEKSKKAQIAELSAQGFSPAEIASRLGLSVAEIDLALNLMNGPAD